MIETPADLEAIYSSRFGGREAYRSEVWKILINSYFQKFIRPNSAILDLGCGYGEFINQVKGRVKYGLDLNPATRSILAPDVEFIEQDCAQPWPLPESSLDLIFTSNFFEHLPDKRILGDTLAQAHRCLKPGGLLIAMGPNIKFLAGNYWDFWDHYLPLTELSLSEGMATRGFVVKVSHARFLPYTMVNAPQYPLVFLRLFLAMPILWPLFGRQFLVIGACQK